MRALALFLLSAALLFSGCGLDNAPKVKSVPPKTNTVEAVLQQQKQAADVQKGGVPLPGNTAPGAGSALPKQPDPDANVPRNNVYDTASVYDHVDYDFSKMDKHMMYTQIYNMLKTPDKYKGKIVRMEGTFGHYHDRAANKHYYGTIVMDATACCSTGIEFSRRGEHVYPENYPHLEEEIIVTGRFESYMEGRELYCHLADAELQKLK